MSYDSAYLETLPTAIQVQCTFVTGKGNASDIGIIRLLRSGMSVAHLERYAEAAIREQYLQLKATYLELWDKVAALGGLGKVNTAARDAFPPFPSHYVPKRPHLTAMFIKDYWQNKDGLLRELRAILSGHALAVDHQRKVVKRTIGGGVVGSGAQTFTICGDFGVVCGVYVVPDTSLTWAKEAMAEVIQRHEVVAADTPTFLFVDCGCCNGKLHRHDHVEPRVSQTTGVL